MSVIGDIIDDLEFSPKLKLGALTGLCGTLAVGLFIVIGISTPGAVAQQEPVAAKGVSPVKAENINSGGTPRPR